MTMKKRTIGHMALSCWILLPLFFLSLPERRSQPLESVPDLEKAMYKSIQRVFCVRLLTITGEIGCSNPDRSLVTAPVQRLLDPNAAVLGVHTVLLPIAAFVPFMKRLNDDEELAKKVAGVVVETDEYDNLRNHSLGAFSPASRSPLGKFAPYEDYVWNPHGSDISLQRYNCPVMLLSKKNTQLFRKYAEHNQMNGFKFPLYVAEFNSVMQTTKLGTNTSEACLRAGSCLPLGGYSVMSSLPPINQSSPEEKKKIILVVATMDSASFFRDFTPGADSPISGMIALLGALDALSSLADVLALTKQLVFLVFTGEAWGYLGSRRLLAEMDISSPSVAGIKADQIDQILEIGDIGRSTVENGPKLFMHKGKQEASSSLDGIIRALTEAAESMKNISTTGSKSDLSILNASVANPGLPPSSLLALRRQNPNFPGILVTEYDSSFINPYYHSHYDDAGNVDAEAISSTATLVARALLVLAGGALPQDLRQIHANTSLISDLIGCLFTSYPGLSCPLAQSLITPSQTFANHYVGVLSDVSPDPNPEYVDDTARFLWNFFASRTDLDLLTRKFQGEGSVKPPPPERCSYRCSRSGQVCMASRANERGICVTSTTKYVPAYSTRLRKDEAGWHVLPVGQGSGRSELDAADSVFTESYWNQLGMRAFKQDSAAFEIGMLILGIGMTVLSLLAAFGTRFLFVKRLKHL